MTTLQLIILCLYSLFTSALSGWYLAAGEVGLSVFYAAATVLVNWIIFKGVSNE